MKLVISGSGVRISQLDLTDCELKDLSHAIKQLCEQGFTGKTAYGCTEIQVLDPSKERIVVPAPGYVPPRGKVGLPASTLVQLDEDVIFYGPHACESCGKMICRTSRSQGEQRFRGIAFDYPDGPIYPNTQWQPHVCIVPIPGSSLCGTLPSGATLAWFPGIGHDTGSWYYINNNSVFVPHSDLRTLGEWLIARHEEVARGEQVK